MPTRKCNRCGKTFTTAYSNHYLCAECYTETAPVGYRNVRPKQGDFASRSYGGTARTSTFRRSVILRGEASAQQIIRGLALFLKDIYCRPTRISTILQKGAFLSQEINRLNEQKYWNAFALAFCPELREWLYQTVGSKACEIIIDYYGLYGDAPYPIATIARNLCLSADYAINLRFWALKQLRTPANRAALEDKIQTVARAILTRNPGDRPGGSHL